MANKELVPGKDAPKRGTYTKQVPVVGNMAMLK